MALLSASVILVTVGGAAYLILGAGLGTHNGSAKPIILYVNQGNGVVNGSGFGTMLSFALGHGFNTVFFQVYRQDYTHPLLFSPTTLRSFVNQTHESGLEIFFAIFLKNGSAVIPTSILDLGEDGVSLDLTNVGPNPAQSLLAILQSEFAGKTAVTMLPGNTSLKPDLLIFETYQQTDKPFIKPGIVASVLVAGTVDRQDYDSRFKYALQNSDGVMVFDYAGLLRAGY